VPRTDATDPPPTGSAPLRPSCTLILHLRHDQLTACVSASLPRARAPAGRGAVATTRMKCRSSRDLPALTLHSGLLANGVECTICALTEGLNESQAHRH
jgi:hypothetical protein